MSDTGTPTEPTIIEQDGAIPETFTPAEPVPENDPAIDQVVDKPIEAAAAEPEKPKQKPWFQTRIDELTRQKHEEARKAQEYKEKLALIETSQQQDPESTPKPVFTEAAFQDAVRAEAQRLASQEAVKARTTSWVRAGEKEFGAQEFTDMCNMVASIGAGDSPDFMALVTDPDVIPDGHKVIAAMKADPEEAQRILAMPPVKMAAALTRFATTAKPADKPISSAPKPISTTGGTAKASAPADNDDIKAWMAKRNEQAWDRRKA